MKNSFFPYGEVETEYLKKKDRKLAEVIERIGPIERAVDEDLFSSVIHHIIGQQISTKAQQSIWNKMIVGLEEVNAETLLTAGRENIQQFGMTYKKADYILDFARKVQNHEIELDSLAAMQDDEVIAVLSSLQGIGVWTAEMILLFCLKHPNVFSYGDLAILRGMRMVYHHRKIDRKLFEKYRRRFSPYCSTASLYFWAVAGGALPEMKDYALKSVKRGVK